MPAEIFSGKVVIEPGCAVGISTGRGHEYGMNSAFSGQDLFIKIAEDAMPGCF